MNNSIDLINKDAAKACAKPITEPQGYNFEKWYATIGWKLRPDDDDEEGLKCKDSVKIC